MTEIDLDSSSFFLRGQSTTVSCLLSLLKDASLEEKLSYVLRISQIFHESRPYVPHYQYIQLLDLLNDCAHPDNDPELVNEASSLLSSLPELFPTPNTPPSPNLTTDFTNSDSENYDDMNWVDSDSESSEDNDLTLPLAFFSRTLTYDSNDSLDHFDVNNAFHSDSLPFIPLSFGATAFTTLRGMDDDDCESIADSFASPLLTRSDYYKQQHTLFSHFMAPPPTPDLSWPGGNGAGNSQFSAMGLNSLAANPGYNI
ncbi:hypothetical protein BLNAU_5706 [Blattamonas nauphoetae]|uniref:Uncharacterized protein n=1 Tax=Blattamonas nauphoetae TaxID=2049346 RepID=A0ABQ9Y6K2_9EUKA|nr:hypothetical protein BLNAU_5706 [Blattamonas nauphoetae]